MSWTCSGHCRQFGMPTKLPLLNGPVIHPLKGGDPSAGSPTDTLRGVTGGVYKARERIHRGMLIRDY